MHLTKEGRKLITRIYADHAADMEKLASMVNDPKRPLLFGLMFVFGWETLVMALPGTMKRLSVAYYLQGLVPHAMPNDSAVSLVLSIFRETPPLAESLLVMALIEAAFLYLAARAVSKKEYVLEQ